VYNETITGKRKSRPYRKRKRALSEEETRQRITEAAVELHGSVGPVKTTVSEVARRAGVSRMTVYNHFSTEAELLAACSGHWAARHPYPDPGAWSAVADPAERLRRALGELYEFYAEGRDMLDNVFRDAAIVPPLAHLMEGYWGAYMTRVVETLARGWFRGSENGHALRAALRVALDFATWKVLLDEGVKGDETVAVAAAMVEGVAKAVGVRKR